MSANLSGQVIEHFKRLNQCARGSGNEEAVSDFLLEFAKGIGLSCKKDQGNNVVIVKNAQKTSEAAPVILQAHMDMVCAVDDAHSAYDFIKNPIYPLEDGNIMTGRGTEINASGQRVFNPDIKTTLGADDGIGVASVMAILQDETLQHPPLIVLFTTGEEIGMVGAKKLTKEFIQNVAGAMDLRKARFINVDEEQDGRFCYGCAGGIGVDLALRFERDTSFVPALHKACKILVSGLRGGHSGIEIGKRHANANRLIGRILHDIHIKNGCDLALLDVGGGSAENAIATTAYATVVVSNEKYLDFKRAFDEVKASLINEYTGIETEDMRISLEEISTEPWLPILQKDTDNIISMLYLIPNDVLGFLECDGYSVVETSSNLGIIIMDDQKVTFQCSVRSFYNARRDFVVSQMALLAQFLSFSIHSHDDYSGWAQSPDSNLKTIFEQSYKELFPNDPVEGRSVHAGLECGVFTDILGDIDMIACGPTIKDVHTIKETLYLDTVPKIIALLSAVLRKL